MADLETAVLNGSLFNPYRSSSPARSASSGANTDDELGSDLSATAVDAGQYDHPSSSANDPQTGPKGVISDRQAHDRHAREERTKALKQARLEQERRKMVALTLDEEDDLRRDEEARLIHAQMPERGGEDDEAFKEAWRAARRGQMAAERNGGLKRGLREIGSEGFLHAVERPGWVIVLIYEPGIPRCNSLLASVLQISLAEPPLPITLYRARATSLSFSLLPLRGRGDDEDSKADPDVLPTLLAYKDGELEKTWIRVDWEVKEDGVEGLLRREGILPRERSGDLRNVSDDDDD